MGDRIAATRLCRFGGWIKPRAATATRPLPGANIQTCRYAAARRYAPILRIGILDCYGPAQVAQAHMAVEGQSRRYAALPFLQAASDPGLRPLTRPLPGAMCLSFVEDFMGDRIAATQL